MKKQLYGILIGCVLATSSALAGVAPVFHGAFLNGTTNSPLEVNIYYPSGQVVSPDYPYTLKPGDGHGTPLCKSQIDLTQPILILEVKNQKTQQTVCSIQYKTSDLVAPVQAPMAVQLAYDGVGCFLTPSQYKPTDC